MPYLLDVFDLITNKHCEHFHITGWMFLRFAIFQWTSADDFACLLWGGWGGWSSLHIRTLMLTLRAVTVFSSSSISSFLLTNSTAASSRRVFKLIRYYETYFLCLPHCWRISWTVYTGKHNFQWVETNPSNIRIFPMDIHFIATWWCYANSFYGC